MSAPDEIVLTRRGGTNPQRVPAMLPACSWELSAAGMFSCFARMEDLRAAGYGGDLKGAWLTYTHDSGLRWGGVVMGRPITDGVAEIAAMSWAVLLRGRLLAQQQRPVAAPAGALVRKMLTTASRDEPTFLTFGQVDEDGAPLLLSWGAEDVFLDLLPILTADSGSEWRVDQERAFHFGRTVGRDLSASVRLVEDRHVAGYRVADDLWSIQNRLIGIGAGAEIEERTVLGKRRKKKKRKKRTLRDIDPLVSATIEDAESVQEHGPIEGLRVFSSTRDRAAIEVQLRRELDVIANPDVAVELTVLNEDRVFGRMREGDYVTVDIGSAALRGRLKVHVMALDTGGDSLRVAGTVEVD